MAKEMSWHSQHFVALARRANKDMIAAARAGRPDLAGVYRARRNYLMELAR